MWPWEHLAFAYLLASGFYRLAWRDRPTDAAAILIAVGALLPDLVDKPLAWGIGVLPTGRSLGHSLLVAVPVLAVVMAVGRRTRDPRAAVAFAIATLSHLAGDVLYPLVVDGELRVEFLLWPLIPAPVDDGGSGGLFGRVAEYFVEFLSFLATPRGALFFAVDLGLVLAAIAAWYLDGMPGLPDRVHP
jgi:hypothetical protein